MGKEDLFSQIVFTDMDTVITRSNKEMGKIAYTVRKDKLLKDVFVSHDPQMLLDLINTQDNLKEFKTMFYKFLHKWRYREADAVILVSGSTWLEKPEVLLSMIRNMVILGSGEYLIYRQVKR